MLHAGCVMAGEFEARVSGLPDLRAALLSIAPKLRKRALRTALAAGARVVRDAAKRATPVLKAPVRGRKPGTVRDAISVRTSKNARKEGDVGVFIGVKPISRTKVVRLQVYKQRGRLVSRGMTAAEGSARDNPNDPYYWRWLNFGWNPANKATGGNTLAGKRARKKVRHLLSANSVAGVHFMEKGAAMLSQALEVFKAKIGPQIQRLNGGKSVEL